MLRSPPGITLGSKRDVIGGAVAEQNWVDTGCLHESRASVWKARRFIRLGGFISVLAVL